MSIPKRYVSEACASIRAAHNALPHVIRSVDTRGAPVVSDCLHELRDVGTVRVSIIVRPAATWTRVSFDVEPDHSIVGAPEVGNQLIDLSCGALSPAREHINIHKFDSSGTGVRHVCWAVPVHGSI